jgi:hypothetical protein
MTFWEPDMGYMRMTSETIWVRVAMPFGAWVWDITASFRPQQITAVMLYMTLAPIFTFLHYAGETFALTYFESIGIPWWSVVGLFLGAAWVMISERPVWHYMVACVPISLYSGGLATALVTGELSYVAVLPVIYLSWGTAMTLSLIRLWFAYDERGERLVRTEAKLSRTEEQLAVLMTRQAELEQTIGRRADNSRPVDE